MNQALDTTGLGLEHIFHPSDFSQASEIAFAHALKLALIAQAKLSIMHVNPADAELDWIDFPGVRSRLERWGLLPPGSARADVAQLGMNVRKIITSGSNPASSILRFLNEHPTDLIVLATRQRAGLERLLHQSIAQSVSRQSRTMTLFVPHGTTGFINLADGTATLRNILIPIDTRPRPQVAVEAATVTASALGCEDVTITFVYVGEQGDMPAVEDRQHAGWTWNRTVRTGPVVEQLLQAADEHEADLIVMSTQGRDGFLDALRGSTTERVLHGAPCPVLTLPAFWP